MLRQRLVLVALVVIVFSMIAQVSPNEPARKVGFGELLTMVEQKRIARVDLNGRDHTLTAWTTAGKKHESGYPQDYGTELVKTLRAHDVAFTVEGTKRNGWLSLLTYILPFVIFIGFWIFLMNQVQGGGSKVMSFGKSAPSECRWTPQDHVPRRGRRRRGGRGAARDHGVPREPEEVPDARRPHSEGRAAVGPPGTGKTLLASAVAGEAGVPFFSISGSDFVEMFVGVGAARVRDMFEQAKQKAPCIIFIDELDAVGRHRGAGLGGGHDEREQTLNQLLVEMDGFEMKDSVIVMAATNRPEMLDPALLRPGRFDRQIVVDRPDRKGREKILEVHTRGKPLAREIDMDALAGQTPGFTGADLANLVNEAALLAARNGKREITQVELEEGVERVIAGPEKKTRVMGDKERRSRPTTRWATRWSAAPPDSDPVHKVSIIGRGQALGYTISMPTEDKFLTTRAELHGHDGDDARRPCRRRDRLRRGHDRRVQRHREGHRDRQADGDALRHVRKARPAGVRPRPGHAVPRPRVSAEPDYSDEIAREIDDEIRRIVEAAQPGQGDPHPVPRLAREALRDPRQARDDREDGVRGSARRGTEEEVFGAEAPPHRPKVADAARSGRARRSARRGREAARPRLHPPRVPELPSPLTPTAQGEARSSGPGTHS